jgi:hypothetical protein
MGHRDLTRAFRRLDDVVAFLRRVVADSETGSLPRGHGIFARTYLRMTLEVIAHISAFEDPAWMARFAVSFADRYRIALDEPERRVRPWRTAFIDAERERPRVIRVLVLGINAHMAYDLATVLEETALDDAAERRRRDYVHLNALLARAVDPVGKLLGARYGRWIERVDGVARGLDEGLTMVWFTRTRERAWADALALRAGRTTHAALEERVDQNARTLRAVFHF